MDADSDSDEDTEELCDGMAAICLSKETKQRIRAPWAKALIVKVFGKTVGFNFLHAKLMGLWKPAGRVDMVDLGKDFFLMRFSLTEDLELVLKKGPWFIGEHFLSIRKWEANFKPSEAQVSSVAVWVRFHELPIEYYDAEVLRQIGRALGRVLRVDTHTATEARGRYARVCVQVDVSKPLVTAVRIGQRNQPVAYEGVSKLCFSCGRLGHRNETCPYTIKPPPSPRKESHVMSDAEATGQTTTNPEVQTETQTEAQSADQNTVDGEIPDASFGPWMVVSRKKNNNKEVKQKFTNSLSGLGSDIYQGKTKEMLEKLRYNKVWAGPNDTKDPNGKRKAQADLKSSPSVNCSPLDKALGSQGLVITGLEQDPVVNVGHVSKDLHKLKPKSGSVKGKKEYARGRVILPFPISAAAAKDDIISTTSNISSLTSHSDWSSSISKISPEMNGEFIFGANPDFKVGNQLGPVDYGDAVGDLEGNPSLNGMEISPPANGDECRNGSLAIDKSGLGKEARNVAEDQIQAGSDDALCGNDAGQRPDEDGRMGFDGGSDTPASI